MDHLAIGLFVLLFATADRVVGANMFPDLNTDQEIQLALAASFVFGIISAWRKDA
jgi:hypothetical protein